MATRISPPQNKTYYINPAYLTFNENSGYGANLIQVSASSSCYISVYDPANGIGYSDADRNYQRWKVTAYNNKFPTGSDDKLYHIYVRLEVKGTASLIVYDTKKRGVKGGLIVENTDENGDKIEKEEEVDKEELVYYYIRIGEVSRVYGSLRTITYDTGYLISDESANDKSGVDDMFELDKYSTPWLIRAKQWFHSFTVKGFVTLVGGLIFKKGDNEKIVTDVKRSTDSDDEFLLDENGNPVLDENGAPVHNPNYVPADDNVLATAGYVKSFQNDKYLRKDQDDSTEFSIGVGSDLTVGGDASVLGDITFKGKQISRFTRYYDEQKPEYSSDVDFYSALMTDKRIEEEIEGLDERYLRKDEEDTAHKHITFEEGITVYDLAKMANLEVGELATISRAIVDILGSSKFVDGFAGEGYQVWKSIASGDWNMTIDRLTVRKVMTIYELIIQKIRSVGGMLVVSAGNGKIKSVEKFGLEYRLTFEDVNSFSTNDLIRCQTWTGNNVKYYWVEVTGVDGSYVYTRMSDYDGVVPEVGDECVLMGNTRNKLRQNLILISATEDGQPRFDCLDGVKSRSFENCLKVRVGSLDGISDNRFPVDRQPSGYGLYGNNCFLTGVFVLSTGVDVETQFSITEGKISGALSSIRSEINDGDNYLSNASFGINMDMWSYENDIDPFLTDGGLLHLNDALYSEKKKVAFVVNKNGQYMLRLKNSWIKQSNGDYNNHPAFKIVDVVKEDEDGNETTVQLYQPRMFYVSFRYIVEKAGTLNVYFQGEDKDGFDDYDSLSYSEYLTPSIGVAQIEIEGKWNGTGDFYLSFDGDIYLYDLALADNKLADLEEEMNMRFEITEEKIQANAEHIIETNGKVEEYRGDFLLTAERLETSFNHAISEQYNTITREYSSVITQTAESLTSDYKSFVSDTKGEITESYESLISQTAKEIKIDLDSNVKTLDGKIVDANASISITAESLRSEYKKSINDLKTGELKELESSITQQADLIATKVSQTTFDALGNRVSTAESSITQQADLIATKVSQTNFDALTGRVSTAETTITQTAQKLELKASASSVNELTDRVTNAESNITLTSNNLSAFTQKVTFDENGNITNFSKSGLYTTSNRASLYSSLVSDGMATTASLTAYTKIDDLGNPTSGISISADLINLTGKVEMTDLSTSAKNTIQGYGTAAANKLASDMGLDTLTSKTIISGGYIKTGLIDADALVARKFMATDSYGNVFAMDSDGLYVKDDNGVKTFRLYASSRVGWIQFFNSVEESSLSAVGLSVSSTAGTVSVKGSGISLSGGATIQGLRLAQVDGTLWSTTDILLAGSSCSLPSPSSNKGRVLYVRCGSNTTISCPTAIRVANGTETYTSKSFSNRSFIFVCDGGNWIEFAS